MSEEVIEHKAKKKKQKRGWLERLKDESWEAELLVSAIAIYGTFQLLELIGWWTNAFIDILRPSQYLVGYAIIFFGLFAISILAAMFVIHFFLRAYWIGLVSLNSVFPDYSIEDSVYSEIYTEKMLKTLPKLKDSIKSVDELCSVIFSAAFTFLLIYSYLALFASLYLLFYNLLADYVPHFVLLIPLVLIAIIMFTQMVVTIISNIKSNHQKEGLQLFNFKVSRIASFVIYGPLYKSILQVSMIFGTNYKKKKSLIYLIFVFLIFGAFVALFQLNNTNIPYLINQNAYFNSTRVYSAFYESENEKNTFLIAPEIESDVLHTSVIKVFIPIFKNEKRMQKDVCTPFKEDKNQSFFQNRDNKRAYMLDCYHAYNKIYVNGVSAATDFMRYHHSRTGQNGIITYVDTNNLKKGKNILEVKKEFKGDNAQEWSIPFYYVSKTD